MLKVIGKLPGGSTFHYMMGGAYVFGRLVILSFRDAPADTPR